MSDRYKSSLLDSPHPRIGQGATQRRTLSDSPQGGGAYKRKCEHLRLGIALRRCNKMPGYVYAVSSSAAEQSMCACMWGTSSAGHVVCGLLTVAAMTMMTRLLPTRMHTEHLCSVLTETSSDICMMGTGAQHGA